MLKIYPLLAILFLLEGCQSKPGTLFQLMSPEQSSINFSNRIIENDTLNILKEEYIYNGGGVGIGDFNNDGLQDIYFTGNQVSNALYLNQGDMHFEDVTATAKVAGEDRWCSGVALVDINEDGWLDIYASATMKKDSLERRNLLYINNGLNDDGIPVFTESAADYGIDDTGNTTQAAFFDYDLDGDLDLYLLTNIIDTRVPTNYRDKITDGTALNNDRLYRNDNGLFVNVSKEAGITMEGFGLGITVSDINLDGWPDIYITNDYISNDLLYINNQDGTFTNRVADYLKHQSYSAMGSDVVDFNNDGLVDIVALDMLPENNLRKKQMQGANNYTNYINNERYDIQYQYVRNTLQLNKGFTPDGHPVFSEIGPMAGVYQTDWSWTPLMADFDNDGFKDLIVTNGFPRDVTDRDFANFRSGAGGGVASIKQLHDSIPIVKISNYAFKNNGDLTFADKTEAWGLLRPSFSNGAAYADLDNDGDLDVIINNINDSASVYQNQLYNDEKTAYHFLRVRLEGSTQNRQGIGTKVYLHYDQGKTQIFENALYRGYLSTMENSLHFGLGAVSQIDSLLIIWPDGKTQLLRDIPADQTVTMAHTDASAPESQDINQELPTTSANALLQEAAAKYGVHYHHDEIDKIDFNLQRTLPHKYTQNGPGIAVGDVDGDGLDDFYVSGPADKQGHFFMQQSNGTFRDTRPMTNPDSLGEEMGVLLFDADNDGDLDLYTVGGSYEFQANDPHLQDHLYRNNGQGQFTLDEAALPTLLSSGSCVKAADYDQDGDLDLFVGGRVVPGNYPAPPASYILNNDQGRFTNVTAEVLPVLDSLGMISDALWTDFDNDGQVDLLIAGEWMPITFFRNTGSQTFEDVTASSGISDVIGWWNSLTSGDFDQDGDIDYIAGNLGLNTIYQASAEQPMSVYAKDFDGNNSLDPVVVVYQKDEQGNMAPFPIHSKDDFTSQFLPIRRKFPTYRKYGVATIHDIFSEQDLQGALHYEANHMASSYLENRGDGTFALHPLPVDAQISPLFGMISQDIDQDGYLDVLAVGNRYDTEISTGRYDALNGLYLRGDGKGSFHSENMQKSGWYVPGDAKALAELRGTKGESIFLVTQNQDSLLLFNSRPSAPAASLIALEPMDSWATLTFADGTTQKQEFYYGSTYLSQSTRKIKLPATVTSVTIYSYAGKSRTINLSTAS
ncbi:MAG: VCBS repeat-containing protein [Cyclobacteriaceae bacterium]